MQLWTELFRLKLCSSILPISGWSIETIKCSARFVYWCHWEVWLVTCYPSLDSCILKWKISRCWTCSLVFFFGWHFFTSSLHHQFGIYIYIQQIYIYKYIYIYIYIFIFIIIYIYCLLTCLPFFNSLFLSNFLVYRGKKPRDGDVSIPTLKKNHCWEMFPSALIQAL